MPVRRLRKTPAHLEITAFINLIVVLVPFLLSTAVFTRLAVIDLSLPAQSNEKIERDLKPNELKLEVVVRHDAIEVGDKLGGLIARIPNGAAGPDTKALSALVQQLKLKFPEITTASVLPEPNIPYENLVKVMDAVRAGHQVQGAQIVRTDYFPNISIGDAPVITKQ